jgi:predicted dehydrogenase
MNARYRIAVIGHTGRGDYGHGLDTVWQSLPECQIVAVADADPAGLAAALKRLQVSRGYSDYRKMLDEERPDVVSICPRWIDQHREMVVAAADRGIHCYLEKPLCRTPSEADEMVLACERKHVKLAIAFQTRYSPKLQVIRKMIDGGALGRVLELRARGKEDPRGGGEDLWVLGSHILNMMHVIAGDPTLCFARVFQDGHPLHRDDVRPGNEGIGPLAGDHLNAIYEFPDGVMGSFGSRRNANAGGPSRFGLLVCGEKGQIEILTGYMPAVHWLDDPAWSPARSGKSWVAVSSVGAGQAEPLSDEAARRGNDVACQDLLQAIEEDRQPEANIYEARATVEMITAVFQSQQMGGPVTFPLQDRNNPLG